MKNLSISVLGLGYIGLPTAALLASKGHSVRGTDISESVVSIINSGRIHIVEPDLDIYVKRAVSAGRLVASTNAQPGDVYLICVPTPFYESEGVRQPNIDYVLKATKSIASLVKPGDIVILESTSPVGTTEKVEIELSNYGVDVDCLHIAYCPERVLPGSIMTELLENDRIVGGVTPEATKVVADFYRSFVTGNVLETDAKTAEMCKLTENCFRDVNIAFANELSLICEKEGINVWNLIQLANKHPRVNILQPGVGVGGHCIAVDPWFLIARDEENSHLIRAAREINDRKTDWVVEEIKAAVMNAHIESGVQPKVVCLGLAFKPNIDDLRESPALVIAESLMAQGYDVVAVEPNIEIHSSIKLIELGDVPSEDMVLAVLVKHREFTIKSVQDQLASLGALDFCGALV